MPKAELIFDERSYYSARDFTHLRVWAVPSPVPPSKHRYKYSFVYIKGRERIVGYDNERGKGDHCHFGGVEEKYHFLSIEQTLADFWTDVERARHEGSTSD